MPLLRGVGDDGHKVPLCNISEGGIIEVIPLVKITREGGELKNLGSGERSRSGGVGNRGCQKGGFKFHAIDGDVEGSSEYFF